MNRKLGRKIKHRKNMLRNLAMSVLLYEKVNTTQAKAKEVRTLIESSIVIAKKGGLEAKRKLLSTFMHNKPVVNKLIDDIAKRYNDTNSGFVKLYKNKPRVGDNAPVTTIILSKSKFLNNLPTKEETNPKPKK